VTLVGPEWDSGEFDRFGRGYPRPQLVRDRWLSLNGAWDFAIDTDGVWTLPRHVEWSLSINVPFAPEAPASGVNDTSFFHACWYRRAITVPDCPLDGRLLLHFGAVDYCASVWVNDQLAGHHRGGYTPFSFDITPLVDRSGSIVVVVRAEDDPHDLAKPRGKQDWQLRPHSIWYPRTTGIWQTVWIEAVPTTSVHWVKWTPNLERWEIGLGAALSGVSRDGLRLRVLLECRGTIIADDTYQVINGEVHRRIALSDPGVDDYRNELLWSPESPTLITARLELWGARGELIDRLSSYTARPPQLEPGCNQSWRFRTP